jgi:hypothetical protein
MHEFEVAIREELEIEPTPPPTPPVAAELNGVTPGRLRSLIRKS